VRACRPTLLAPDEAAVAAEIHEPRGEPDSAARRLVGDCGLQDEHRPPPTPPYAPTARGRAVRAPQGWRAP